MKRILIAAFFFLLVLSVSADEEIVIINGVPVKIDKDKNSGDTAAKLEVIDWLTNSETSVNNMKSDAGKASAFCSEVRSRTSQYRYDKKVAAAAVKTVSPLIWSKEIEIQKSAVEVLGLYYGNSRALQYLSRLSGTLKRKEVEYKALQIAVVNAIADVATYDDRAPKVLLEVLKNDYEASDELRIAAINALSRMPSLGTVYALLEAVLILSPDPTMTGTSGDFMKNKKWKKFEAPLYSAIQNLTQIEDSKIPYYHLKTYVKKNAKRIKTRFDKQKKEFEERIWPKKKK